MSLHTLAAQVEIWHILAAGALGLAVVLPGGLYDRAADYFRRLRSRSLRRDPMAEEWIRFDDPYHVRTSRKIP